MAVGVPSIMLDDVFDIKVFICYLLDSFGKLTEKQINDIAVMSDSVNYFDLVDAISGMEDKNLVSVTPIGSEKIYELQPQGELVLNEFLTHIPRSIQEKSYIAGKKVIEQSKLDKSIKCFITKNENDTYTLAVRFLNEIGGPDMLKIEVFAPTREQAQQMQKHFLEHPSEIVTNTMNLFIK